MSDTVHDDLKHGESKQQFGTGAQRDTQEGKVQYSLVPPSPHRRVAMIYTKGAVHYGPNNWTMGIPFSRYLDSAERHIEAARMGMQDEDHLAMAVWNLYGIMHHQEHGPPGLDDLPRWDDARWQSTGLTLDQIEHPEIYPHVFEKLQETGKLPMIVDRVGSMKFSGDLTRLGYLQPIESTVSKWEESVAKEIADRDSKRLGINPDTQDVEPIESDVPDGYREMVFDGKVLIHENVIIEASDFPMRVFIRPKTQTEIEAEEELS